MLFMLFGVDSLGLIFLGLVEKTDCLDENNVWKVMDYNRYCRIDAENKCIFSIKTTNYCVDVLRNCQRDWDSYEAVQKVPETGRTCIQICKDQCRTHLHMAIFCTTPQVWLNKYISRNFRLHADSCRAGFHWV